MRVIDVKPGDKLDKRCVELFDHSRANPGELFVIDFDDTTIMMITEM